MYLCVSDDGKDMFQVEKEYAQECQAFLPVVVCIDKKLVRGTFRYILLIPFM